VKRDPESKRAWRLVSEIYERHRDQATVSPAWLATQVMFEIGADRAVNEAEYLLAHLQARQIARVFCRERIDEDDTAERDDMFPDSLQHRYPRKPDEPEAEPVYVLRDLMTADDIAFNVARLRNEANAKRKHADALEAWGEARRRTA
jgi:hypothetical protein